MKALYAMIISLVITGTKTLAATGAKNDDSLGLMATFFIAFGILIIVFQLVPGLMLFGGMLKGLFSSADKSTGEAVAAARDKNS